MKSPHRDAAAAADALSRLCARHSLSPGQHDMLLALLGAICADAHAPTAIDDPVAVVDLHFADSLAGLQVERLRSATTIADLGSGAGLPGLPLAVALPRSAVSLVESHARKCAFLRRTAAAAGIANAAIANARAEEWQAGLGRQDAVVARALAPPAVVLEYAAPLLRAGGAFIDWRGRREQAEERAALAAAAELGLLREEVLRTHPFPAARERHLHVYLKARATPARFPRRAGVARKRPLGLGGAAAVAPAAPADRDRR